MSIENTEINGDLGVSRNIRAGGRVEVKGSATVGHNLKVEGWLEAKNIKGVNKGVFLTKSALKDAYPTPQEGWFAGVGNSTPFAAYEVQDGEWVATGGTIEVTVDMTDYTERVKELQEDIATVKADIGTNDSSGLRQRIRNVETLTEEHSQRLDEQNEDIVAAQNAAITAQNTAAEVIERAEELVAPRLMVNANRLLSGIAIFSGLAMLRERLAKELSESELEKYKVSGVVFTMNTEKGWQSWQWTGSTEEEWDDDNSWVKFGRGNGADAGSFYNLDNLHPLERGVHYTLEVAVYVVSEYEELTDEQRNGMVIQFYDGERWKYYSYGLPYGSDPENDKANFANPENWRSFDGTQPSVITQTQYNTIVKKDSGKWYFIKDVDNKIYRIYIGTLLVAESQGGLTFPFTFPLTLSD